MKICKKAYLEKFARGWGKAVTTSDLAVLIFAMTVAYFLTASFSKRPGPNRAKLQLVLKAIAILIIMLTVIYFKKRLSE